MSSDDAASQEYHLLLASSRREPPVETNFTTKTVFCGLLAIAFISISYAFIEAPLYRLYEVALCKGYYREHNPSVVEPGGQIPEEKCKVVSIQQDLAILLTTQAQIDFCTCKHPLKSTKFPATDSSSSSSQYPHPWFRQEVFPQAKHKLPPIQ
jgi:hypothetical protein